MKIQYMDHQVGVGKASETFILPYNLSSRLSNPGFLITKIIIQPPSFPGERND